MLKEFRFCSCLKLGRSALGHIVSLERKHKSAVYGWVTALTWWYASCTSAKTTPHPLLLNDLCNRIAKNKTQHTTVILLNQQIWATFCISDVDHLIQYVLWTSKVLQNKCLLLWQPPRFCSSHIAWAKSAHCCPGVSRLPRYRRSLGISVPRHRAGRSKTLVASRHRQTHPPPQLPHYVSDCPFLCF